MCVDSIYIYMEHLVGPLLPQLWHHKKGFALRNIASMDLKSWLIRSGIHLCLFPPIDSDAICYEKSSNATQ